MQPPDTPAFRRLEVHQVDEGDQKGVVLTDPIGLVEEQVFVPEGLMPMFGLFDGQRTVAHIQAELESAHGEEVPKDFVANMVKDLDERLLLMSPRFEQALRDAAKSFASAGVRPVRHAGSAGYPAEPEPLREALRSMLGSDWTPSRPTPRGLVAPHIDLARGREGYALAYGYLAESEPADLYVIFGTGHQGPFGMATGWPADWETPLGTVKTDRGFVDAVHRRIGAPDPLDILLHRNEHSMEFQVLFLQHVLGDRPFEVAAFLTGSLPGTPDDQEEVQKLIAAFRETADASGKKVCFVAGADLAHLGPFFGDADAVSAERLEELRKAEHERLAHLESGDPAAFHASVEGNGNPDRICGTTPMYLTAQLAGGAAELLYYGQAPAPDGSQVVSYCAMAFTGA